MGFFSSDNAADVYNMDPNDEDHKSSLTHEALGAAAGYEAMKKYENYETENGKPESHEKAKEIMAGLAAAEADKLFETKGLDAFDREKVKREAEQQANDNLNY